ncbi:MAG: O-antigen ligase family protein [Planctomycetota bacterium]
MATETIGTHPKSPGGIRHLRTALITVAWVLVFLHLGIAPWVYGGAEPAMAWLLHLSTSVLLLVLSLAILTRSSKSPLFPGNRLLRLAGVFLGLFILYTVGQTLPLPRGLLARLSPAAESLHLREGAATLSLHVDATWNALVSFLSALTLFLAPIVLVRRSKTVTVVLGCLAGSGGLLAAYALLNYLGHNEVSLHFSPESAGNRACGSFVNANHLAAYLAFLLPASLAVLFIGVPKTHARLEDSFLNHVASFLGDLSRRYWKILAALAFTLTALGLVFTLSRAGIVAGGGGTVAFLGVYAALRRRRSGLPIRRMLLGTLLVCILAGAVAWIGLEPVLSRYAQAEPGMEDRTRIWAASLELWREFPVFGTGFGTFKDVFPLHQPPDLPAHYTFPHNEYVGVLVECGVVGTLLLLGTAGMAVGGLFRGITKGQHLRRSRQLAIGWAVGAAAAAAFHGAFDFALHIPAVGFLLCFLLGLGFAAVEGRTAQKRRRKRKRHGSTDSPEGAPVETQRVEDPPPAGGEPPGGTDPSASSG